MMNQMPSPNVGVVNRQKKPNSAAAMDDENEITTAKVIFMGDPAVGKTSIISTFMEGKPQLG